MINSINLKRWKKYSDPARLHKLKSEYEVKTGKILTWEEFVMILADVYEFYGGSWFKFNRNVGTWKNTKIKKEVKGVSYGA